MNSNTPDSPRVVSQCLISFGSNLGHRDALIAEAAKKISQSDLVCHRGKVEYATSRLFETPPIGGPDGQEPFLNAVAAFETEASARDVLTLLQSVEEQLGRKRRRRWDARTIDLDVVLHGQLVGGSDALTVPHPRYTARQFVIRPACDVAPEYRDPRFGWTLRRLADHLSAAVPSLALVGADLATRQTICDRLTSQHHIETFAAGPMGTPMSVIGNAPLPHRDDPSSPRRASSDVASSSHESSGQPIVDTAGRPWVAAYLPTLPVIEDGREADFLQVSRQPTIPRLIVRMQRASSGTRDTAGQSMAVGQSWADSHWPAPHQIWPAGWRWPEYRLEIDDLDWAVGELASALESMRCPVAAVTQDGQWW